MVNAPGEAARRLDAEFMRQALLLAERGRPTASPNPVVGCVIVGADGVVAGRGYHERAGGPHAEIVALRQAGARARGATMYVTLEPCCHTGRTGPCAVAVAEAGVTRVVAAMVDPNPAVSGKGLEYLRTHGVETSAGVCEAQAASLNEPFVTSMTRGRPFVLLKIAASADARVAAAPGERTALTSAPANDVVHGLRAWVDAIAVGAGTAIADDPQLTARLVFRERPLLRVLVDWRLRVPLDARMLAGGATDPVLVVAGERAASEQVEHLATLRGRGIEVLVAAEHDLAAVMRALHARQVRSLLVEGGARLHRAFVEAGLADRLCLFVTPVLLGRGGLAWDVPVAWANPPSRVVPMGPDVMLEFRLGA